MKRFVVFFLTLQMILIPILANAATCVKWEQQCKEDPFDPGKVECTQHCFQWDYSDENGGNSSGSNNNSGGGGGGEFGIIGSILGVVLVIAVLAWALNGDGR